MPYKDEAPSFNTSTRSIAASGMDDKSTEKPFAPCSDTRRPFKSTSVLEDPMPRRLALALPKLLRKVGPLLITPMFDERLSAPLPLALIMVTSCSALTMPALSISSL